MNQLLANKINNLPTIPLAKQAKDLTNKRQGSITFLKPAEKRNGRLYWWALCDCGEIFSLRADSHAEGCSTCSHKTGGEKTKNKLIKDLTGQKFGKLTVISLTDQHKNNHIVWHCKCDCGNEIDVIGASLISGNTKSCGCVKKETSNFVQLKANLTGQKFGYLTVLRQTDQRQYGKIIWECQCECGNIIYLNTGRLTSGNDTSCGCKKNSLGASKINQILKDNNINFIKQYGIELNKRRFDFAILNQSNEIIRLIEYDGQQHYYTTGGWNNQEQLLKCQQSDKEKNQWAKEHNIPLVRIPYTQRDHITLDILLGDKYLVKGDA